MIKEELKQEAEEWLCNNLHSASEEDFIKAMVDIAEPREKRIAELEKENAELKEKLAGAERTRDNLRQIGFPTFQSCKEYADTLNYAKAIIKGGIENGI